MLDPVSKKEFKENILRLKEEKGLTVISITHDKNETLIADKVLVLNEGKIVFDEISSLETVRQNIENEIPFEIPDSWCWCRLKDVAAYKKGPFGSSITKSINLNSLNSNS